MIEDKILIFFKQQEGGYVSGEDLSHELGISRTAIWKHIEKLREEGYDIEASPHLGYRLISIPDRLTAIELSFKLETDIIGKKIYSYKEIGSTNDAAYKLALEGEKEGSAVIAELQSAGRGRLGRKWVSPKGKGAYVSIILRPNILPRDVSNITLFSALSVVKAIREMVDLPTFIKWPNDILVNNKKACGILTEMNGEADKINFVIVGIGININTKMELLPEGATSLAEELKAKAECHSEFISESQEMLKQVQHDKYEDVSRIQLVRALFRNLDKYYKIFRDGKIDDMIKEYKELSMFLGRRVEVSYHDSKIEGYAIDVDKEGALILRMDSGLNERVLAGDVVMLR